MALATVPGIEFDPRARSFDVDELKPQPIIRKRPKIFVSESSKDDKYWEKRIKNNVAARRYKINIIDIVNPTRCSIWNASQMAGGDF